MPSTVISDITYDTETALLRVTFISGIIYEYKDVPEKLYKELRASLSKGRYLNYKIKGNFECIKIDQG